MIEIVTDPQVPSHAMAEWAIKRLPGEDIKTVSDLGPFVALGIIKDGKPVCVVIYNWFRQMEHGNDCRVIICSDDPSWCLPGVLRELFRYPFEVAGCERITAVIRDGNNRSLKLCLGLGFRREGVMRRAHNGRTNALLLGMLKHECKWLKRSHAAERKTNGKKVPFSPEAAGSSKNGASTGASEQRSPTRELAPKRNKPVRSRRVDDIRVPS